MVIVVSSLMGIDFLRIKVVGGPKKVTEKKVEIATTEATNPNLAGPNAFETTKVEIATIGIKINRPARIFKTVFSITFFVY